MARPRILDYRLIEKIAKKTGKEASSVAGMVSRRANNLGISAQAALVILAKENGIGASTFHRSLDVAKQAEVRGALPSLFARSHTASIGSKAKKVGPPKSTLSKKARLKLAVEHLIEDQELMSRCQNLLLAPRHFDIPINQATQVLEDRIRKKAQPAQRLVGEKLVSFAFSEDPSKTVLRVASNESDDQRGFTQILRGFVPAFRNKTHHDIINTFSSQEALRVCGFVDVLLRVVDSSRKTK